MFIATTPYVAGMCVVEAKGFVDPTTRAQMRVFMDPSTGGRRYVAEG